MKAIGKLIFSVFSNMVAIFATSYFITGFLFEGNFIDLLVAAAIFTAIHTFVEPLLKLIFGPLIFLTLGLFIFVINALGLYLLDIFSAALTIQGYLPLVIATLIIGIINYVISFSGKLATK